MEMGRRDVRRGGGTNLLSNKLSRKSKKALKKLGLGDADENMNHKKQEKMMCYKCPASYLETDVSSMKKKNSKLPNKVINFFINTEIQFNLPFFSSLLQDTNGVDHHASVPRKLRSAAMKKRNLESVKKENQAMDAKSIVRESITKDEKEVAETLYGLADMFTDSNFIDNKSCDPFLSDGKETSKVDSMLVMETDLTTKAESVQPAASFLSSPKPKQIDEEPLQQQQDHNQRRLTGLKQSSSVNAQTVSKKSTPFNLLSSTKLPHWMMGQALSLTKNASLLCEPLSVRPRKFKRCASHIYICRLIKALQRSKSSPVALLNQTEERSLEMSQCRLPDPVTTISDFKTMVPPSKRYQSPKPVEENMTQLGLDLSLSSSGATQSHLPFTNLFPQYPISAAYNSQLSPAPSSHQQMSPYLASRFQTAYNANQQLHKRLWAAQYRPPSSSQYSKPRLSFNRTSIQPLQIACSPRYINSVSQQQHRFMATSAVMSMSHHHNSNHLRTVMNRQEHHFPLIYEDTRTPLQLLCYEQS
ncbi:uncharacterized protein LOC108834832 isoform X2 [Raphanus sativus]|uniref:Uncharacterized protein LOC108834832 isoform X2 n=1 Tax=Raphanus sativus TaxID=3726 RepID=A0A9W3C635_RAPSA|nr:uncharacterized protein LOC108834832 isoform X2 [Raphanus sativus]